MNKLKKIARFAYQIAIAAGTYFYHLRRFVAASNLYIDNAHHAKRGYHLVRIYHALEKSMSFSRQRAGAGAAAVGALEDALLSAERSLGRTPSFFESTAQSVLQKFKTHGDQAVPGIAATQGVAGGVFCLSEEQFTVGKLSDPELFFNSRYSLREYADGAVPPETVLRAVKLALKTPSVCNRQEWAIYHTNDSKVIEAALAMQSGNRGFGDKVQNLAIVTTDLSAFVEGKESYQPWVDGGMLAMSFVYALHSLGLGACCLNWSQTPAMDKKLRDQLDIDYNHTVAMMVAFGFPDSNNVVCASDRRDADEIMRVLRLNRK